MVGKHQYTMGPYGLCQVCNRWKEEAIHGVVVLVPKHPFEPRRDLAYWSTALSKPQAYGFGHCKVCGKTAAAKVHDMAYEIQSMEDAILYEDEPSYPEAKSSAMPFARLANLLREARYTHNILDQEEVWIGRDGLKVELAKMSARYATNIMAYLRKNARFYHNGWATWEFMSKYADQSADDLEDLLEQRATDKVVRDWMKERKLYKALETISKNSV